MAASPPLSGWRSANSGERGAPAPERPVSAHSRDERVWHAHEQRTPVGAGEANAEPLEPATPGTVRWTARGAMAAFEPARLEDGREAVRLVSQRGESVFVRDELGLSILRTDEGKRSASCRGRCSTRAPKRSPQSLEVGSLCSGTAHSDRG